MTLPALPPLARGVAHAFTGSADRVYCTVPNLMRSLSLKQAHTVSTEAMSARPALLSPLPIPLHLQPHLIPACNASAPQLTPESFPAALSISTPAPAGLLCTSLLAICAQLTIKVVPCCHLHSGKVGLLAAPS